MDHPTSPRSRTDVLLTGVTRPQKKAGCAALQGFLANHGLASWGLNVNVSADGPQTWQLDISAVAPPEFDFQTRSDHFIVIGTMDLASMIGQYLEAHYNACMNSRAIVRRSQRKPARPEGVRNLRRRRKTA
jgi:hypothetical protein